MKNFVALATLALAMSTLISQLPAQEPAQPATPPMLLWAGRAPGVQTDVDEEKDTTPPDGKTKAGEYVIRLGNISRPTITVYRPTPAKDTGAAVVVCPGGGYSILAYNLEGTEVCAWLNSIGVTGVLLKYRVPGRLTEKYLAPLQDAQRALSLVRSHAKAWGIDTHRVGMLGFSAGAHLSAVASTHFETHAYEPLDEADKESCRPDFTILIYPAYLTTDDLTKLAPDIKVTPQTPPAFIVQTQDDTVHVENAYVYGLALKNAKVPAELHIYPKGGHGYGLRPSGDAVSHWPQRAAEWLASQGWLRK